MATSQVELLSAILRAFEHRREVVEIAYDAQDEAEALTKIGELLSVGPVLAGAVLDQSFRRLLAPERARLEIQFDEASTRETDRSS